MGSSPRLRWSLTKRRPRRPSLGPHPLPSSFVRRSDFQVEDKILGGFREVHKRFPKHPVAHPRTLYLVTYVRTPRSSNVALRHKFHDYRNVLRPSPSGPMTTVAPVVTTVLRTLRRVEKRISRRRSRSVRGNFPSEVGSQHANVVRLQPNEITKVRENLKGRQGLGLDQTSPV